MALEGSWLIGCLSLGLHLKQQLWWRKSQGLRGNRQRSRALQAQNISSGNEGKTRLYSCGWQSQEGAHGLPVALHLWPVSVRG